MLMKSRQKIRALALFALLPILGLTGVAAQAASVKIENDTDTRIEKVYISPSYADTFDRHDYMGDNTIGSEETWVIQWLAGDVCHWDFRVVFSNGQRATSLGNDLCEIPDPIWKVKASSVDDDDN